MLYSLGKLRPQVPAQGDYFVADNATVVGSVVLRRNASVWFNAVVRGDCDRITVGENSNVQDAAVLHTDHGFKLALGRNVTVGHHATVHGCKVGDNSLIGIHAVVLNGAVIGRNCLIGANALIPEGVEIPDNSLVLGSPARVKRSLSDSDVELLTYAAEHYVDNFKRFLAECRPYDSTAK